MSWEPVSLAHWDASLKAHAESERTRQANQQSDARDWTNRPLTLEESNAVYRKAAHDRLDAHYARLLELCDIAIEMEKTHDPDQA